MNSAKDLAKTDLRSRLKAETMEQHRSLESNPLNVGLSRGDLTHESYLKILRVYLGFWRPLEKKFKEMNLEKAVPDLLQRLRAPKLERDLGSFGLSAAFIEALPDCSDLPTCSDAVSAMGVFYVLEGSTMGAKFIAKKLETLPFLDASKINFFSANGEKTEILWREFISVLEKFSKGLSPADEDKMVAAARQTFDCLNRWSQTAS